MMKAPGRQDGASRGDGDAATPAPDAQSGDIDERLHLSHYTHLFRKGESYALYHALNCNVAYGGPWLADLIRLARGGPTRSELIQTRARACPQDAARAIQTLVDSGFLTATHDEAALRELRGRVIAQSGIKTLYLSTTLKCNLRCTYCISRNHIARGRKRVAMSRETAFRSVDYYVTHANPIGDKELVFYGGEPLTNWGTVAATAQYLRHKETQLRRAHPDYQASRIILCTNGTLLREPIADFIRDWDIYAAVSLDGPPSIHDRSRPVVSGAGSFALVERGCEVLKKARCAVGITMALGAHNVEYLAGSIEFLAQRFAPQTVATNVLVASGYRASREALLQALIEGFEVARAHGVYMVKHVMDNRVKPFVERRPRLNGCTGHGSRIMVLPGGELAPCSAFASDVQVNIAENPSLREFIPHGLEYRSPFFISGCADCPAIAVCGGGCAYVALQTRGSVWQLDEDHCHVSRGFLKWMIWDLHAILLQDDGHRRWLGRGELLLPQQHHRRCIYGAINVEPREYAFQFTAPSGGFASDASLSPAASNPSEQRGETTP